MRALVKSGHGLGLQDVSRPRLEADDDVIVRVVMAGVCRTDLRVADGTIAARDPIIVGHELAGVIEEIGRGVSQLAVGARVTVEPYVTGAALGIDRDGAFADFIRVPARAVHELPERMPFLVGAYTEPVAAALGVTDHPLPRARGLVVGDGRIATLTARILRAAEHEVDVVDHDVAEGSYAFAVDTRGTQASLALAIHALARRGILVVRSRDPRPVPIAIGDLVTKELMVRGALHASFDRAIAILDSTPALVGDLSGAVFPLERYEDAFAAARASEATKVFLVVDRERA